MQALEERDAPVATGPGAETLRELACHAGAFAVEKSVEFSQAHAKAEADMIVGIHHCPEISVSCVPLTIQREAQ